MQGLIGLGRAHFAKARQLVDSKPLLIMENGGILEHNLTRSRLTQDNLMAKLREANVFNLRHVHAVVFETTGDVSALHGDPRDNKKISSEVLQDMRR